MSTLDDLVRLRRAEEAARDEAARAAGAAAAAAARLREEFGCESPAAAQALLARLAGEGVKAEEAFRKALAEYEARYGSA